MKTNQSTNVLMPRWCGVKKILPVLTDMHSCSILSMQGSRHFVAKHIQIPQSKHIIAWTGPDVGLNANIQILFNLRSVSTIVGVNIGFDKYLFVYSRRSKPYFKAHIILHTAGSVAQLHVNGVTGKLVCLR